MFRELLKIYFDDAEVRYTQEIGAKSDTIDNEVYCLSIYPDSSVRERVKSFIKNDELRQKFIKELRDKIIVGVDEPVSAGGGEGFYIYPTQSEKCIFFEYQYEHTRSGVMEMTFIGKWRKQEWHNSRQESGVTTIIEICVPVITKNKG